MPPVTFRCDGVRKSFDGVAALAEIRTELPQFGITAIVGPNGAGKTTLLNVLTGFVRPDDGRCFLGGVEITRLRPHRIARLGVARTFQDLRLITQIPVLDNVLLARQKQCGEGILCALAGIGVASEERRNRAAAIELLQLVNLDHEASALAAELSYGQQKLLTFACCLGTEARILLLDEPVAGVHPEMADKILSLLRELRDRGKLIFFVEHDISVVRRVADHVVVMDAGRIIAQGAPSDVLDRPEIIEAYLG